MKRFALVLTAIFFIAIVTSSCEKPVQPLTVAELLDLGEKYLLELNYEQALVQFLNAIEIEPMNPRGYTGAAEAYIGLGQPEIAMAILEQGRSVVGENQSIQIMINEIHSEDEWSDTGTIGEDLAAQNPPDTPGAESQQPSKVSFWNLEDWVINGISVFSGSPGDFAASLNAELRFGGDFDDYFGLGPVTVLAVNITEYGFDHTATFINDLGLFWQIETSSEGYSGINGITIGKTTIIEAIEMFPLSVDPIGRDDRGVGFSTVDINGDGWATWIYNTAESRNDYDGNSDFPDQLLFAVDANGWFYNYSIHFRNGVANHIWFENVSIFN